MNAVQSPPHIDPHAVLYRSPQEPMAAREVLALNPVQRTFSRLMFDTDGSPRLVAGQSFSLGEFAVLHPIVASYPDYCPFEEMLAMHYYGSLNEAHVAECREQLQQAIDTNTWVEVIGPIRSIISRLHHKVRQLGVDLGAEYKTGYVLQAIGPTYQSVLTVSPTRSSIQQLLHGFLPHGHLLAYNPTTKMLSYLTVESEQPRLMQEALLTLLEERVLLPVFKAVPNYCSDEVILANYIYGDTNEESLTQASLSLEEAKRAGQWDYMMRPVRNAMSRARLKVRAMGISIPSLLATGYMATYVGPQLSQRREKGGRPHG